MPKFIVSLGSSAIVRAEVVVEAASAAEAEEGVANGDIDFEFPEFTIEDVSKEYEVLDVKPKAKRK